MFKKRAFLAIVVTLIIVCTTTFSILMYLDRRTYMNIIKNQYQKDLYNLGTNVNSLQVSLSKSIVSGTPKQSLLLFGEISKNASNAQDSLNALPINHGIISQTSKFLAQVSDFSYALLKSNNNGNKLSKNEWTNVEKLKDYASYLSLQIQDIQDNISSGNINWGEIKEEGTKVFEKSSQNNVSSKFKDISTEMQQYPTLIYDGPFSENVLNIKPRVLLEKQITLNEAKKKAIDIANDIAGNGNILKVNSIDNKKGQTIPTYSYSISTKNNKGSNINVDISKNGGNIVYLIDERPVLKEKISMQEAIVNGKKFLDKMGYKGMIPTFSLKYDSVAVINYVYVQNKVVVYPDQIKLKIALDNGKVIGVEAQHYLIAHYKRNNFKPMINVAKALSSVSKRLNIKNKRLTLIPMESLREVLCYEFYGDYNGEKYIVYINASDGNEERILKILETPNGELTM